MAEFDANAMAQRQQPPTAEYLKWFLANADLRNPLSPTHKLGTDPGDASPGDHNHRGRNSRKLLPDITFSGDLSTTAGVHTALRQVMAAMVLLGATDNSTN